MAKTIVNITKKNDAKTQEQNESVDVEQDNLMDQKREENENQLLAENESLKKDIFNELKEVFKREYDKKLENLQCDLKNKIDCLEKKHEKDLMYVIQETFKKLKNVQQENFLLKRENKDLKNRIDCLEKKHEKVSLEQDEKLKILQQENKDMKNEFTNLKENLQTKTATNYNLIQQNPQINPNFIQKVEIDPQDFQFQNESVVLLDNSDGTMTIKEETKLNP